MTIGIVIYRYVFVIKNHLVERNSQRKIFIEHLHASILLTSVCHASVGIYYKDDYLSHLCRIILIKNFLILIIFSRDSDLTTSVVLDGCGYVKSQVWLCSKRCGYVKVGVVMLKMVWLCCHQNLNTPFQSWPENGVAGVVMLKMVWLC